MTTVGPQEVGGRQQGTVFAVAMLFFFMVVNFADKAVLGLTAVPMMRDLGLTPSQFGFISSAFFFLFSVAAVLVGFVVNRIEARWALLVMMVIWSLTQFPIALAGAGFATIVASRIALGAAQGPANPVANHALYKFFPNEKRSLPASIVSQGTAVGVVIAVPVLGWIITSISWQAAYVVLGVVGLVWAVIWAKFGREGTETTGGNKRPTAALGRVPYRKLFLNMTSVGIGLSEFGVYWGMVLVIAWFPAYLQIGLGLPPQQVYIFATVPWLLSPPIVMSASTISQRLMLRGVSSRRARGMLSAGCCLIGGALLLTLPMVETTWLKIAVISLGITLPYVILTLGPVTIGEIAPPSQRAAALSVNTAFVTSAGIFAPWVTGFIIERAATPAEGYLTGFMVCGAISILSGIVALLLIRPEDTLASFKAAQIQAPDMAAQGATS